MTEQQRAARNQRPHKPAIAAMLIWGYRYSRQSGGSMDFWDSLREPEKAKARRAVAELASAPDEQETRQ